MYSKEQYDKALEVYEETKSVAKTITILGYPARRQTLYNWINRKRILLEGKSTFRGYDTADYSGISHWNKNFRYFIVALRWEKMHNQYQVK